MLMRNERLATLRTRYDDATGISSIDPDEAARRRAADLATKEGRLAVEAFFRRFMPARAARPAQGAGSADGYRFTDFAAKVVSIINLASVAALESVVGVPVNPLRFRANLYVDGLAGLA